MEDRVNTLCIQGGANRALRSINKEFIMRTENDVLKQGLRHITLTSGHERRSYADEVGVDVLAACARLIVTTQGGGYSNRMRIPGVGPYYLSAYTDRQVMGVTVCAEEWMDAPVIDMGVALGDCARARSLWKCLHERADPIIPPVTDPRQCPATPWIGVTLRAAIILARDSEEWLGDLERCLAWTWAQRLAAPSEAVA